MAFSLTEVEMHLDLDRPDLATILNPNRVPCASAGERGRKQARLSCSRVLCRDLLLPMLAILRRTSSCGQPQPSDQTTCSTGSALRKSMSRDKAQICNALVAG